ncbi:MAG TPA: hypothetical protein VGG71_01200, partial [Chitinophagaceae bacterium]
QKVTLRDEQLFRHKPYDLELQIGQPIPTPAYSPNKWNTRMSVSPYLKMSDGRKRSYDQILWIMITRDTPLDARSENRNS